jgi:hypothetical protein
VHTDLALVRTNSAAVQTDLAPVNRRRILMTFRDLFRHRRSIASVARKRTHRRVPLQIEVLESRTMLDGTPTFNLDQVQFENNVPIVIGASTPIGTPGGPAGSPDIQWQRPNRTRPDTHSFWNTNETGPVAYVEGQQFKCLASFSVSNRDVRFITVTATIMTTAAVGATTVSYGNFGTVDVSISGGTGSAVFTTDTVPTTVYEANVRIQWQVTGYDIGGNVTVLSPAVDIQAPTFRVYTLKAAPVAPMATPWAPVLELATGMAMLLAGGRDDNASIVAAETTGIYTSAWKRFAANTDFLNMDAASTLVYNPSIVRTRFPLGIGTPSTQRYGLGQFLSALQSNPNQQQCNDNSNLDAILCGALGVSTTPLFLTSTVPGYMYTNPYFRAGNSIRRGDSGTSSGANAALTLNDTTKTWAVGAYRNAFVFITGGTGAGQIRGIIDNTATRLRVSSDWIVTPDNTSAYIITGDVFTFHQVLTYNDNVYDPSTGSTLAGPPFEGLTVNNYLTTVFVSPSYLNIARTQVTTLQIGDVGTTGMVINSVSPTNVPAGVATTITVGGAFLDPATIMISPVLVGTSTVDPNVTVGAVAAGAGAAGSRITFTVTPTAGHARGQTLQLLFTTPGVEGTIRILFNVTG